MDQTQLTPCEAEVMDIVWRLKAATVQEVVDALPRSLAYTTVMTTLKILDDKGIVRRAEKRGRAYVYYPAVSQADVRHSMVSELTRRLFGGSIKSLVLSLVQAEHISVKDLNEVKEVIRSLEEKS